MEFPVAFKSGVVEARGVRGGRTVTAKRETSGKCAKLALETIADSIVNVTALDAQGREVPDANDELIFEIEGAGELLGVGNGNPLDHTREGRPAKRAVRKLYNGKAQAVIRTTAGTGGWKLRVKSADGRIVAD